MLIVPDQPRDLELLIATYWVFNTSQVPTFRRLFPYHRDVGVRLEVKPRPQPADEAGAAVLYSVTTSGDLFGNHRPTTNATLFLGQLWKALHYLPPFLLSF
jgi:hypothetical protein